MIESFKNYIGFSRDHSGSMSSIARHAARDYNTSIASIREAAIANNQDTIVSVVECGWGNTRDVRRVITNSNVTTLSPISESAYSASGRGTPLWDSVGELIEMFEAVPDVNDPNVSFLIMVTTDGQENSSTRYTASSISAKIKKLQATDRWTFVFRVPRGGLKELTRAGIPEGNIQEWDQTARGVETATARDKEAFSNYFVARSSGVKSTTKFYTDLSNVSSADVAVTLTDVSSEVQIWPVANHEHDIDIRAFVESRLNGGAMLKGAGFYQLTKTEPEVQDHKKILIRDRSTGGVFFGIAARQMLGLPTYGTVRVTPGNHGGFDIFIQSTSVNRKLKSGTSLVYWPNVGVRYKEGPSAR